MKPTETGTVTQSSDVDNSNIYQTMSSFYQQLESTADTNSVEISALNTKYDEYLRIRDRFYTANKTNLSEETQTAIVVLISAIDTRWNTLANAVRLQNPQVDIHQEPRIQVQISYKDIAKQDTLPEDIRTLPEQISISRTNFTITGLRKVKGDGNCFYTALAVGVLEACANDVNFRTQFHQKLTQLKTDISENEKAETTIATIQSLLDSNRLHTIEEVLQDNRIIFSFIHLFREWAAYAIQEQFNFQNLSTEDLKYFITYSFSIEKDTLPNEISVLLDTYIRPFGKEGFGPVIQVLSKQLGIALPMYDTQNKQNCLLFGESANKTIAGIVQSGQHFDVLYLSPI